MASTVTFSGLGSNIDFSQIADAVVAQRMVPIAKVQQMSATYGQRVSALKDLNGLLLTLKNASAALANRDLGTGRSAISNDNNVITASADTTAAAGSVSLKVGRLATSLVQKSRSFSARNEAVLAGGAEAATFTLYKGGVATDYTFDIDESNNTLDGLRAAINASGAGVTASVVDVTGAGEFRLVLTSQQTGAAGRVELVETTEGGSTGTLDGLGLTRLNAPADPSDFSTLNSELTVNGLTINRPTNSIADALAGVKLELKKTGDATVTVSNAAEIQPKLQAFVNAYNAVQDYMLRQYKADSTGRPSGVLAGEQTLRTVQQQLRDVLGTDDAANGGALKSLSEIGLGRDSDGRLTLDTAALNEKLANSFDDVRSLLRGKTEGQTGVATLIDSTVGRLSDDIDGTVQVAIKGYQSTVDRLNDSASRQLTAITLLKDTLTRQFAHMDAALGQLNSTGTALSAIIDSMKPKDS